MCWILKLFSTTSALLVTLAPACEGSLAGLTLERQAELGEADRTACSLRGDA